MSRPDKIHIVICDYNGWSQTQSCLRAVAASHHRAFEVVVVDHGTTTETARALAAHYPEVHRVAGDPSLWWTGATNLGIRAALARNAKMLMLLNNDCYVAPSTLGNLVSHVAPVMPAIIAPLQRAMNTGALLTNRATTCFALGFTTLPLPAPMIYPGERRLLPTGLILGGRGVLIPVEVFERVGLFNEIDLPHYGADHDFFIRCRRAGVGLYLALDAFVDIDDTRTTHASNLGQMSIRQFAASLADPRSHRNIRALSALFQLHYPVRRLHFLGTALNIARYALGYASRRFSFIVRGIFATHRS